MPYLRFLFISSLSLISLLAFGATSGKVDASRPTIHMSGGKLYIDFDLTLDSLHLGTDNQLYISPLVEGPGESNVVMPAILVNGRNMHISYQRGTLSSDNAPYEILQELRRFNGKPQKVTYSASVPAQRWMLGNDASVRIVTDTCGCGRLHGRDLGSPTLLNLNPAPKMHVAYVTPEVTELPVSVHEGRARVQFEVDRTELHAAPFVCRNGQRIDNRQQLKIINDSIAYALSDPNVEIASVNICGYASPESPYLHNEQLSTNRSRALAEYIAASHNLPTEKCTYTSVPENWMEFREIVETSAKITPTQRAELITLIDRPAYGPSDYDAKERELKTDPRFAKLYRSLILPEWFPLLRCTEFTINTRLKPLSDQALAEVMKKKPSMMSLNQMMRVARLYPEGSTEFNEAIETARSCYPDDAVSNLNAAVAALKSGDTDRAAQLVAKGGKSPEAENLRGVIAVHRGDFAKAAAHFRAASPLPEADRNLNLIEGLNF